MWSYRRSQYWQLCPVFDVTLRRQSYWSSASETNNYYVFQYLLEFNFVLQWNVLLFIALLPYTTGSCTQGTCGENADCTIVSGRPVCSCPSGYVGDPIISCRKTECFGNSECAPHQTCRWAEESQLNKRNVITFWESIPTLQYQMKAHIYEYESDLIWSPRSRNYLKVFSL